MKGNSGIRFVSTIDKGRAWGKVFLLLGALLLVLSLGTGCEFLGISAEWAPPTAIPSPIESPTFQPTMPVLSPTLSPEGSATPAATLTSAAIPTSTPIATPIFTPVASPTSTPTPKPPATATATPIFTPTASPMLTPTFTPTPEPTPTAIPITEWKGEYFANRNLGGEPALVRNDSTIDFDWGTAPPAAGLPYDGFSVRWSRTLGFVQGAYRFYAEVDDGVRVFVDDILLIDQWRTGPATTFAGHIYLADGPHSLKVEYFDEYDRALIRVWWEQVTSFPQWKGEYYANMDLAGDPAIVRNDETIDFNWKDGSPEPGIGADSFSIRWSRKVYLAAGDYRFYAQVDDGVRLRLDDWLIIDEWKDGAAPPHMGPFDEVGEGEHTIVVEYYEHTGNALAQVWWESFTPAPTSTPIPTPTPTRTPTPTPTPLPDIGVGFDTLDRGRTTYQVKQPRYIVLVSPLEWDEFRQKELPGPPWPSGRRSPADIDWEQFIVLGAFMGEQMARNPSIEIVAVRVLDDSISVQVVRKGESTTELVKKSWPYHLVTVSRGSLPQGRVRFVFSAADGTTLARKVKKLVPVPEVAPPDIHKEELKEIQEAPRAPAPTEEGAPVLAIPAPVEEQVVRAPAAIPMEPTPTFAPPARELVTRPGGNWLPYIAIGIVALLAGALVLGLGLRRRAGGSR